MKIASRGLALALALLVTGCPEESKPPEAADSAKPEKKEPKKPEPSASAAPAGPSRQDLAPFPVTIELPSSAKITEKTDKSAMIEVEGGALNISTDTFDSKKNTVKNFPFDTFTKWVKDEPALAVAEMAAGPNYRAVRVFTVDGKKYVCQNVGTKGTATAEAAEKIVALCETLQAKK
jgi:hypothetical protein